MIPRTRLEARMIRRRLRGLNVSPCRLAPTPAVPLGRAVEISTRYRATGPSWSLGYHTGEDYAAPVGSLAVAPSWGRVIAVGTTSWGAAYGTMVVVRAGAFDYAFCHLSSVTVAVGDRVRPGTVVGRVGITGNTTGPHLHFEARPNGGRFGSDVHPARIRKTNNRK
jgi:murein DD-endopeptidase MepM/ murein hydrolase activator NlpD